MVGLLRNIWIVILVAVSLGYVVNNVVQARAGRATNPVKGLLIVASVAWWWYSNVYVADILIGLILFEIFHDVQYLAIVWVFNCRRAREPGVGQFTRFVFRRSWGLLGLYLGMVFAYGGLGPLAESTIASDTAVTVAKGLITASTLLHFYFDGFIWKVREESTRRVLGVAGAEKGTPDLAVTTHGLKWLLLLPAAVLWVADGHGHKDLATAKALAGGAPAAPNAWFDLALELGQAGNETAALAALERTLALNSTHAEARQLIAMSAPQQGYRLWQQRRLEDAVARLQRAVELCPELPQAHLNLALALRDSGRFPEALSHAQRGARLLPEDRKAQQLAQQLRRRLQGQYRR